MIITLCGSARFEQSFHVWNEVLTLSGHTVFSLAVFPSTKYGKKNWYTDGQKTLLDEAHFKKIAASDAVLVLNKYAYIGESTLREIEYARSLGKKLYALESWGAGNGIGPKHTDAIRKRAQDKGCLNVGSPIDTFYPYFNYPFDLLPEAGQLRNSLVDLIHSEDKF